MLNNTLDTFQVGFETKYGWLHFWVTLSVLTCLILCTIVGNVFVVAAILLEKHLQVRSNFFGIFDVMNEVNNDSDYHYCW